MANIKDVAREAGVSVATVSRIMNNRGSISEKTRQKVFAVMKELDYHPNEMARYLQTGRSHILGLVIPYIDHPFFSLLTAAISEACQNRGYRLMLCTSGDHPDREQDMVSMLRGNKVDGILITSRAESASMYAELSMPVVSIERTIPQVPSISCDNYAGGVIAAQTLQKAGCRKVLVVGNAVKPFLPAKLRHDGFREECERLGLPCEFFLLSPDDLNASEGFQQMLQQHPDVDGYFVTGDTLAVRLTKELQDAGKLAPRDYKLVGFDGLDISDYFNVTTVAQPIREMGELAVDTLLRRIEGQLVPSQSILPVQLIERSSAKA